MEKTLSREPDVIQNDPIQYINYNNSMIDTNDKMPNGVEYWVITFDSSGKLNINLRRPCCQLALSWVT